MIMLLSCGMGTKQLTANSQTDDNIKGGLQMGVRISIPGTTMSQIVLTTPHGESFGSTWYRAASKMKYDWKLVSVVGTFHTQEFLGV